MGKHAVALVALLIGCKSTPSSESSTPPVEVTQQRAAEIATQSTPAAGGTTSRSPSAGSAFHSIEDLAALGLNASRLETGETLLCGARCVCTKPLDCTNGGCISFEENIAAFRAALKSPGQERTVSCRRAETGRCGQFRYFDFEGDLHRRELRWFDETGAIVAQRNVVDYDAYCGDQTQTLFVGRVPRCEGLTDRELICGEGERPRLTALEDLRRFTAPPAAPH